MNPTLTNLLGVLELGASITMKVAGGDVAAGAGIADGILSMIQKAMAAYQSHTGQPIDLALLLPSDPLTDADVAANASATSGTPVPVTGDPTPPTST